MTPVGNHSGAVWNSSTSTLLPSKITFDGMTYEGYTVNGLANGPGRLTFQDGTTLEGEFVDGHCNKGTIRYVDGHIYEGEIRSLDAHGKGRLKFSDGNTYEGQFLEGQWGTGWGKLTFPDGSTHEGEFYDGQSVGRGKFTNSRGAIYEGNFFNWHIQSSIANLGDPFFLQLLLGKDGGSKPQYPMGIISDFLSTYKNAKFTNLGKELKKANSISQLDDDVIKETAVEIHQKLMEGESHLLFCNLRVPKCFFNFLGTDSRHALGINIAPIPPNQKGDASPQFANVEIFNSGCGLGYHQRRGRKFQTMLRFQVPMNGITPDVIGQIMDKYKTVDEVYQMIKNLPGAVIVDPQPGEAVWQTAQKGNNCSLEWIFAWIKNAETDEGDKITEQEYNQFRADLFRACIEAMMKSSKINPRQHRIFLPELCRKEAKRLDRVRQYSLSPHLSSQKSQPSHFSFADLKYIFTFIYHRAVNSIVNYN